MVKLHKVNFFLYFMAAFLKIVLTKRRRTLYTSKAVENQLQRVGILAQLGEHLPYKQRVIGSSPIGPIRFYNLMHLF